LLKLLALRWANDDEGYVPLIIDWRKSVQYRKGLREYCRSSCEVFRLNATPIRKRLETGQADSERNSMMNRLERALDESSAIHELAGNILILTMMAILSRDQELPRNRVALYREASRFGHVSHVVAGHTKNIHDAAGI